MSYATHEYTAHIQQRSSLCFGCQKHFFEINDAICTLASHIIYVMIIVLHNQTITRTIHFCLRHIHLHVENPSETNTTFIVFVRKCCRISYAMFFLLYPWELCIRLSRSHILFKTTIQGNSARSWQ